MCVRCRCDRRHGQVVSQGTYITPAHLPTSRLLVAARLGATASEIAEKLFLSEGTVCNYLSGAMAKTGGRNRAQAVQVADERGWL